LNVQYWAAMGVIPGIEVKIFYPVAEQGCGYFSRKPPAFHIKGYLFQKNHGRHSFIIGSSNLTASGLSKNHEWNYFSNAEINFISNDNKTIFMQVLSAFDNYWNNYSLPMDKDFFEWYMPQWTDTRNIQEASPGYVLTPPPQEIKPRGAQGMALNALEERRKKGINKTAVIAATGLGKTWLAAFDFKQSGLNTVLFIAHRETILNKAQQTFRLVTGDFSFGAILSGKEKSFTSNASLFAMVQTLSQPKVLEQFDSRYFDYIVIDEFHHAEAKSYRRILEKFKPVFLLGLTATPERMDGRDVLKICNYDVAFEMRLVDAINNDWLVPFQYFAIYDTADYSALKWTARGYIEEELDKVLIDDTRAELVFRNLRKFLPSSGKIKALAFCASRQHSAYMSEKFNALGSKLNMRSISLDGSSPIREREQAMQHLQDEENDLQIICSVDIFSEGIDIPAVSHVVFLRPTQSFCVFLQQLGRGLRKVEGKEYLVALDFVGNFKQSYVAPLAVMGYGSTEEYKRLKDTQTPHKKLPAGCHVSVDTNVQRIWDAEIKALLQPRNRLEFLQAMYLELRSSLGYSPALMDFYRNPAASDPCVFIRQKEFGGNWLRVKHYMEDLLPEEESLLDTPAEFLLQSMENAMGSAKPTKMFILEFVLNSKTAEWRLDSMLRHFRENHPDKAGTCSEQEMADMCRDLKVFAFIGKGNRLQIREEYMGYWNNPAFIRLARDITEFCLARHLSMMDSTTAVAPGLRGYYVSVPYTTARSQYTMDIIKAISNNSGAWEWLHEFGTAGYSGEMDIEVFNDRVFTAWTPVKYDDLSRFPARIKAAATALYRCGQTGKFHIEAKAKKIRMARL